MSRGWVLGVIVGIGALSAAAAGYQAHVAKPFEPGDVARLVRRLVNQPSAISYQRSADN